jgi:hypothetical protein
VPAAPASADVPPAGGSAGGSRTATAPSVAPDGAAPASSRDPELVAPVHGYGRRRADLKALITGAQGKAAGAPATGIRTGPLRVPTRTETAVPHNAIGMVMPGRDIAGVATHRMPVPAKPGLALRGAAINGTTMGHVAAGPASIGGPANGRSGIDGTSMRPKH